MISLYSNIQRNKLMVSYYKHFGMSKVTPEEVLHSVVESINTGNLESLMMFYESDVCFASQAGLVVKGREGIRQSLQGFVDMRGKTESKINRIFKTSNLAHLISKWSFSGTGPDGNLVNLASTTTDVLLQQPDGTWRVIIDNPWGTE
jgi:ketosteroid isomerase-like protein